MWTIARFAPTSLFSLRPAQATASGAQTLLVPTPFAIKMALIDVTICRFGVERAKLWWAPIRDADIAIAVPEVLVVNKTFIKIQRPTRVTKSKPEEVAEAIDAGHYPLGPTIAFREFVQFGGDVAIAVKLAATALDIPLIQLLTQINYLGKRGGFLQLQAPPSIVSDLDETWTVLTTPIEAFLMNGTLQLLDDCGRGLTWEHIDVYANKGIKLNRSERTLRPIVLPVQLTRSSRGFSLYERIV